MSCPFRVRSARRNKKAGIPKPDRAAIKTRPAAGRRDDRPPGRALSRLSRRPRYASRRTCPPTWAWRCANAASTRRSFCTRSGSDKEFLAKTGRQSLKDGAKGGSVAAGFLAARCGAGRRPWCSSRGIIASVGKGQGALPHRTPRRRGLIFAPTRTAKVV